MGSAELQKANDQLDKLKTKGSIKPNTSPWGAPILLIGREDGWKRLYIYYRGLNKVTIINQYALPKIDDLLNQLGEFRIFSKLDLKLEYQQAKVKE